MDIDWMQHMTKVEKVGMDLCSLVSSYQYAFLLTR